MEDFFPTFLNAKKKRKKYSGLDHWSFVKSTFLHLVISFIGSQLSKLYPLLRHFPKSQSFISNCLLVTPPTCI